MQALVLMAQALFVALLYADIGAGAEPVLHLAFFITRGIAAHQERVEQPITPTHVEHHFERGAGDDGMFPARRYLRQHIGLEQLLPAAAAQVFELEAGEFIPALVIPGDIAGGVAHPDELRNRIRQLGEQIIGNRRRKFTHRFFFAFARHSHPLKFSVPLPAGLVRLFFTGRSGRYGRLVVTPVAAAA